MSVQKEIINNVSKPTRKAAWSLVGIVVVAAATSIATPIVYKKVKSLMNKGAK